MDYIIIFIQVLTVLVFAYLLFFFQQKGKNLADKNDLKKITEIVEEVKKEKSEEIELLRSNLSILSNKKIQIFSEEKEAIIVFFAQLNSWLWDSLNIRLSEYNHTNFIDLSQRTIKMRDSYNQTQVAFNKVELLVNDYNLFKAGHEVIIDVLKLHHFIEGLNLRLYRNLSWEKSTIDQITSDKFNFQKLPQEMKEFYISESKERKEEKESILNEYHSDYKTPFDIALRKLHEFKEKAKSYLRD